MNQLLFHPLANIFPLIVGEEFSELVEDIRLHGVRDPIFLLDGKILDGRNRYRAMWALVESGAPLGEAWGHNAGQPLLDIDLDPDRILWPFQEFGEESNGDPLDFVISKNLRRRQLSDSQRALIAAEIATARAGDNQHSPDGGTSQAEAASLLNVSKRSVERAVVVRDQGSAELQDAVRGGDVPIATAETIASLPTEQQTEIILTLPRDADGNFTPEARKQLGPIVKELRAVKQQEKRNKRDAREAALAQKLLSAPTKVYGVAIEDFEWDHKPYSRETGMDRHPSNHYQTAADAHTPEEIVARTAERFKCLAEDSVLYMWATIPHMAIAHKVMELRGFTYKSQRCWDKVRPGAGRGPGYWVTGEHEILLIGVRGKFNCSPIEAHFPSRFEAPVGEHSEKPDQQYEHAEFHFPSLPKIELNARRARAGWDAWGFDAPLACEPIKGACCNHHTSIRDDSFADEYGMVKIPGGNCVAVDFVTRDEWALLHGMRAQTSFIVRDCTDISTLPPGEIIAGEISDIPDFLAAQSGDETLDPSGGPPDHHGDLSHEHAH